jgi:hypothetical protein
MVVIGPEEELLKSPGMLLQLVGSAGQHNQEFITLQPGELSLGLQVLGQGAAHGHQQLVAQLKAEGVVDGLELVQIEIEDAQPAGLLP